MVRVRQAVMVAVSAGMLVAVSGVPAANAAAAKAPTPPRSVTAKPGDKQVTVSWAAPTSNGGSPITKYTVTSTTGGKTCNTTRSKAGTIALSCVVTGLTNGTKYQFVVRATSKAGKVSGPSAATSAVIPVGKPTAPTEVFAVARNGKADVSWNAPTSNGGRAITKYTVTSTSGGKTCTSTSTAANPTPNLFCTVPNLTNGTAYTFTVVATNAGNLTSVASTKSNAVTPKKVDSASFSMISAGQTFSCAVKLDGRILCWGSNDYKELGRYTKTDVAFADAYVQNISNATFVSAGETHACAVVGAGAVQCWGYSGGGLGNGLFPDGADGTDGSLPVFVKNISDAISVSSGNGFSCAALRSGSVKCWGINSVGQLGNGSDEDSAIPVTVTGINNAVSVDAGYGHACAVLKDGTVKCWGENYYGQLGNESGRNKQDPEDPDQYTTVPVTVVELAGAKTVSAGGATTCATTQNEVKCWGYNNSKQLGGGEDYANLKFSVSPIPVSGLGTAKEVSVGRDSVCARPTTNEDVYCWGNGNYGKVGTEASLKGSAIVPEMVESLPTPVSKVSVGAEHACAIVDNVNIYCWGKNDSQQLGYSNDDPGIESYVIPAPVDLANA